jgi:hypothetical protein
MTNRRDFFEPDAEFDAAYQRIFETIREATVAAQREGWGTDRDPDDLLITAWSVVHGFAMLWVDGSIQDRFGSIDPDGAASAVIDTVYGADARGEVATAVSSGRGRRARSGTTRPRRTRRGA